MLIFKKKRRGKRRKKENCTWENNLPCYLIHRWKLDIFCKICKLWLSNGEHSSGFHILLWNTVELITTHAAPNYFWSNYNVTNFSLPEQKWRYINNFMKLLRLWNLAYAVYLLDFYKFTHIWPDIIHFKTKNLGVISFFNNAYLGMHA